ncbi:MAG: site-specific integrase, partial [Firmicutes bacterium]|nr:site-specific integrase [Bacillota bacterium]
MAGSLAEEFVTYLVADRKLSPKTIESYSHDLAQFGEFLSSKGRDIEKPGEIDYLAIRDFMTYLASRGYSRRSIARKQACLRTFFKYLCSGEVLSANPAAEVATPKLEKKLPQFLEEREIGVLLQQPDASSTLGMRDRAILETIYATGLRVGELASLDVSDIDYSVGYVVIMG